MKSKFTFLVLLLIGFVQPLRCQDFITEWTFPSAATQISFNALTADGPVNYTWSCSLSGNSGEGSFTRTTAGSVTISGLTIAAGDVVTLSMTPTNLRRFYMSFGANPLLTNVTQWGNVPWSSMQDAFRGCQNLQITATDIPNLSGVTSMYSMFNSCNSLNGPSNMNNWNIANVTETSFMFRLANNFNQYIGDWDTSSITAMREMFFQAMTFNQDIGSWNTSAVIDMHQMFSNVLAFNQDIGNWDTSAVTDMRAMFSGTQAFNQDISNWNTSSVVNMEAMLNTATAFNQNLGSWILHPDVNLSSMLNNGGMDCDNYSATLIGWEANNPTITNRNLGAFNRVFGTSAVAARNTLVTDRGWTINDTAGGDACDALLSTVDFGSSDRVHIYPNPSAQEFTLKFNKVYQQIQVEVFNVSGQVVLNKTFQNVDEISLNIDNGVGIYFLKVHSDYHSKTFKLIKI